MLVFKNKKQKKGLWSSLAHGTPMRFVPIILHLECIPVYFLNLKLCLPATALWSNKGGSEDLDTQVGGRLETGEERKQKNKSRQGHQKRSSTPGLGSRRSNKDGGFILAIYLNGRDKIRFEFDPKWHSCGGDQTIRVNQSLKLAFFCIVASSYER